MFSFLVALQFLTRLPSPVRREITLEDLGASIGWFPAVGAAIGGLLLLVDTAARALFHPAVASALDVVALVAITGALHLDGVIDTADGFAAGPGRESRLAAMHQAHAGTTGTLAGCLVVLVTYIAIASLADEVRWIALIVAPTAGRTTTLLSYYLYPYARPEHGFSRALKDGATPFRAAVGLATAAGVAAGVATVAGLIILGAGLACSLLASRIAAQQLGGLTGDVIGATGELSQLTTLITAALLQAL